MKTTKGVPEYKMIEGKRYTSLHDNPIKKGEAQKKAERVRDTSYMGCSVRVVKVKGGYAVYKAR